MTQQVLHQVHADPRHAQVQVAVPLEPHVRSAGAEVVDGVHVRLGHRDGLEAVAHRLAQLPGEPAGVHVPGQGDEQVQPLGHLHVGVQGHECLGCLHGRRLTWSFLVRAVRVRRARRTGLRVGGQRCRIPTHSRHDARRGGPLPGDRRPRTDRNRRR